MKKTFILDTNVLLHDINSIYAFEDNDIVIPMVVIEELDSFKSCISKSESQSFATPITAHSFVERCAYPVSHAGQIVQRRHAED